MNSVKHVNSKKMQPEVKQMPAKKENNQRVDTTNSIPSSSMPICNS